MAAEAIEATLKRAWNILNDSKVPAALMGGLALAQWGRIRVTQDVDVLIELDDVRESAVLARLAAAGYRSKGRIPIVRLPDAVFIQLLYEPPNSCVDIQSTSCWRFLLFISRLSPDVWPCLRMRWASMLLSSVAKT